MKYRKIGNLEVSAIGLGCMGMSHSYEPRPNRNEMIKLIRTAYDMGVTFFDTAETYGSYTNEELLGEAAKPIRDKIILAAKCGQMVIDNKPVVDSRPEVIRKSLEGSLKRLQTDYIDLYYIHRVDPKVPIEDTAGVMKEFIEQGKIRTWGISEPSAQTIKKAHAICQITAIQSGYSMWRRNPEKEIFEILDELKIGFVPFSPLGKGFLTGKLKREDLTSTDFRSSIPKFSAEAMKTNQKFIDFVNDLAKSKGLTSAQLALAWVLAQRPYIAPIPGATKLHRLEENLKAADIELNEDEIKTINAEIDKIDPEHKRRGTKTKDYAEFLLNRDK